MRLFLVLFLLQILVISGYSQNGWRNQEMEVRVTLANNDEAHKLGDLHLNGDIHALEGHALMYVVPSEYDRIQAAGLKSEILKSDLNEYYRGFWKDRAEAYHNYDQIIALMDSLATAFPDICKKIVTGTTLQGRQLTYLKISDNVGTDENEPEVLFDGGIHGDEIGGPENLVRFARDLCTGYGSDPQITGLIDSREIFIYPMVNPDGRANMSRYNSNYVDCNRDGGYMWNGEGNSPGTFSQLETKALRNCVYEHHFVIHITYHSGEEVVLWPWCYRATQPPDYPALHQLAVTYSGASGYPLLQVRQSYADYPTNGETIDYSYGLSGTDALTMEISNNKQPPGSQIQYYYHNNVPAMMEMLTNAGFGLEGIVTDSVTGLPVRAALFVDGFFPVYSDSVNGYYHKYLPAGTYSLRFVANDYLTGVINNITVPESGSTTINIQLQPFPGHFVSNVATVVIPGNNFQDEANTPGIIGPPDNINYSLGKNGVIHLDMQYPVPDIEGNDFTVVEGDSTPEGFVCYVSQTKDGPWVSLGDGLGTTSFDLSAAGVYGARFIMIVDDNDGTANAPDAGFDLDAVESLYEPAGIEPSPERISGSFVVYPDPATDKLTVETENPEPGTSLELINAQGQVVIKTEMNQGKLHLDISTLDIGVYLVRLAGRTKAEVKRFSKR